MQNKTKQNTRLDPTGDKTGLILAQAGCPGGSAISLTAHQNNINNALRVINGNSKELLGNT
jgi:hypothetical protein